MKGLWCAVLIGLIAGQSVNARDKDPNDPNGLSRTGVGAVVKDPNDPNELWWTKWDAVIKDPNNPIELLSAKWDAAISVLRAKDIDEKTKEKIVSNIVTPIFDFPLIAKLALGRKHWPKLTPPEREKFTRLFTKRLKTTYQGKVSLYTDETASFEPALRKGRTLQVPMQLTSKDKKIAVLYKLRRVDKRWKIYDVEIEGVSILLTYRSQFDDILLRGTVKDLLSRLENPPAG